jgi:hypothetical protein
MGGKTVWDENSGAHFDTKASSVDIIPEEEITVVFQRPADVEELHEVVLHPQISD